MYRCVMPCCVRERFYLKGYGSNKKGEGGGGSEEFLRCGAVYYNVIIHVTASSNPDPLQKHSGGRGGIPTC